VRPDAVSVAARWFQSEFKGDVFYAVKANPSPWVIRELAAPASGPSTSRR
jgi:ornithine decarboxylase